MHPEFWLGLGAFMTNIQAVSACLPAFRAVWFVGAKLDFGLLPGGPFSTSVSHKGVHDDDA